MRFFTRIRCGATGPGHEPVIGRGYAGDASAGTSRSDRRRSSSGHGCRDSKDELTMAKPSVYSMTFARIYPLYIQKAESKGRTKAEVDEVLCWLTGHDAKSLKKAIDAELDLETFLTKAPRFHPKARLIKGVVCGIRVEEIQDKTMRRIRYMDKLIDELAKGKAMAKILRT
jgi:hypothetical protein